MLAAKTSVPFEAIVCSFLHIATYFKSHFFPLQLPFPYILIGTFAFLPSPPSPPPFSVGGQLGLCGARAVAVGGLRQRVAIRLPLLGCVCAGARSLGAGGACEESQGAPADEGEPIELGGHEQSGTEVTVPWHRQGNHVEGNGRVPG